MPLQDHIHLGLATPLVSDVWSLQHQKQFSRKPEIIVSVVRGLSGKLHAAVLGDTSGPLVLESWRNMTLVIDNTDGSSGETDLNTLISYLGKEVKFVPPYHTDSAGEPDSGDILTMRFVAIRGVGSSDQAQQYFYPVIDLEDAESEATYAP